MQHAIGQYQLASLELGVNVKTDPLMTECSRLQLQCSKVKGAINLYHIRIRLLVYVDLVHTACACMTDVASHSTEKHCKRNQRLMLAVQN